MRDALPSSGASRLARLAWLPLMLWLMGCTADNFNRPASDRDEAVYTSIYPYYAEFCALSQIMKKPGFGADIRGQIGGHSVFYLNGACQDPGTDYPTLRMCDSIPGAPSDTSKIDGVGLSVNEHFSNANWVAIPGRAFFFDGTLQPGDRVTKANYAQTQARAKQLGIYRRVSFHAEAFQDKPPTFSDDDYKYEVSVSTDYAIGFGRGRYCARVPVNRAQMLRMIGFLNAQNAPYRDGSKQFEWSLFRDNCIHLAHNALAAAGIWQEWPIDWPLALAIFDFPVPKNEFVNLMRRTNDPPDLDPSTLYHDQSAARSLAQFGRLPWIPGALADAHPPHTPNDIYDTDVQLAFYDEPILHRYQKRLDAIFSEPRYFNLEQNLEYFAALYRRIDADRKPIGALLGDGEFGTASLQQRFTDFYNRFYAYVDAQSTVVEAKLNQLRLATVADKPVTHLMQVTAK